MMRVKHRTKKESEVNNHYSKQVASDGKTVLRCNYCNHTQYSVRNATKMGRHLVNCRDTPESVKTLFPKYLPNGNVDQSRSKDEHFMAGDSSEDRFEDADPVQQVLISSWPDVGNIPAPRDSALSLELSDAEDNGGLQGSSIRSSARCSRFRQSRLRFASKSHQGSDASLVYEQKRAAMAERVYWERKLKNESIVDYLRQETEKLTQEKLRAEIATLIKKGGASCE